MNIINQLHTAPISSKRACTQIGSRAQHPTTMSRVFAATQRRLKLMARSWAGPGVLDPAEQGDVEH
jgi:hypothetical protein